MKLCDYMGLDWFKGLQREVDNSTKADVAKKMGICRAKLSQVMNGCGAYGTGAASTAHIEREYRRTFEQLVCTHTQAPVGIDYCREHALASAPTQNPMRMMHWQACQQCEHKPKSLADATSKPKVSKAAGQSNAASGSAIRAGKATGPIEAETEGFECIGGPMDNPYPVEDQRHDYCEHGYKQRREFERKQRERFKSKEQEPVQQAGIIDTVTLPLPVVGGPQINTTQEAA